MEDPNLNTPYAYRVDFLVDINVHPVLHISELEPAANDPYPGQVVLLPPPVEIDGDEEWEVEEVLDAVIAHGRARWRKAVEAGSRRAR